MYPGQTTFEKGDVRIPRKTQYESIESTIQSRGESHMEERSCCTHSDRDSMRISEVGGSESAFRPAPRDREIVSFVCSCVRARGGMPGGNRLKSSSAPFPFSLFPREPFPFPFGEWVSSSEF